MGCCCSNPRHVHGSPLVFLGRPLGAEQQCSEGFVTYFHKWMRLFSLCVYDAQMFIGETKGTF